MAASNGNGNGVAGGSSQTSSNNNNNRPPLYKAPSGVTASLVPDGKLIDHDTAEVTALPDSLNPKGK